MIAINMRTEYLVEPLGLSIVKPRFYWHCSQGVRQRAYQIIAKNNKCVIWDSGKVVSDKMTHVLYEGTPLKSRDRIEWSVLLWDEKDAEGEWSTSWFEMGLLIQEDWQAKWISGAYKPQKNHRYPVDCFRKELIIDEQVDKARLYITAHGLYEAQINGQAVGDVRFGPGCTDYRHRLQYQTYDITNLFVVGENQLEIQLADGWYRGSIGCFGLTNVYGRRTKLLAQLELTYMNGQKKIWFSDDQFLWSDDGPIRFADLKDGEVYDGNLKATYANKAIIVKEKQIPVSGNNVPVKEQERFKAKMLHSKEGRKVLDFGQNIAGYIAFSVEGKIGKKIHMRFAEILDEKGNVSQMNIQKHKPAKEFGKVKELLLITGNDHKLKCDMVLTPKQEVSYVCRDGLQKYKTTFALFGFRYMEIDTEIDVKAEDFEAIAVYSDMTETGHFECSNDKINRFYLNTVWSMKGNFLDIPTDCPTRERLGWTGDGQVFFNTSAYIMDVAAFYRKWLYDFQDGQTKEGKISAVLPYAGADMLYNNTGMSVGWADAVVLIPYRFWKRYGDLHIIRSFYPLMYKYAMYMIKKAGPKKKSSYKDIKNRQYIYERGFHLGEWLEPEDFKDNDIKGSPIRTEEATAYMHYTMKHMSEIAETLGVSQDVKLFSEYAQGAKLAYQEMFLNEGQLDTDRQAKLVRPLAFDLIGEEKKGPVSDRLRQAVENRAYRIGTGFLSTPFVLPVLSETGHLDEAYKMLENEKAPSWLHEVNEGATTVWEDWEGQESHNHYSPGAVCEWLYTTVAGINVAGENHFVIEPKPGGTLTYAKASYESIYGLVESRWQKNLDGWFFEIKIPPNTSAEIRLPNHSTKVVGNGVYKLQSK